MERLTVQRRVILDVVKNLKHSTIDEIFVEARKDIPSLSISTIYRNLTVLETDRLIRRIPNKTGKDIYESTCKDKHSHFLCLNCGRVIDYCDEKKPRKVYDDSGNLVYESTKISYGICKCCLELKSFNQEELKNEKI